MQSLNQILRQPLQRQPLQRQPHCHEYRSQRQYLRLGVGNAKGWQGRDADAVVTIRLPEGCVHGKTHVDIRNENQIESDERSSICIDSCHNTSHYAHSRGSTSSICSDRLYSSSFSPPPVLPQAERHEQQQLKQGFRDYTRQRFLVCCLFADGPDSSPTTDRSAAH